MSEPVWHESFLAKHLDERGDLKPPWAQFPLYERGTIGWRMGTGETWLMAWWPFVRELGDRAARLAYLKRHPAAPQSWAGVAARVLVEPEDDEPTQVDAQWLIDQGCIANDVAYRTWVAQESAHEPPIPWDGCEDVPTAGRHWQRQMTFYGRWWADVRSQGSLEEKLASCGEVPPPWSEAVESLRNGRVDGLDPNLGGVFLVHHLLATGDPPGPWEVGFTPDQVTGGFDDVTYADSLLHWLWLAFDDVPSIGAWEARHPVPEEWGTRIEEQKSMVVDPVFLDDDEDG